MSKLKISVMGHSLSLLFVITYIVCAISCWFVPSWDGEPLWQLLLPGVDWQSITGFLIGLFWIYIYGWYFAVIYAPLYNFFKARSEKSPT